MIIPSRWLSFAALCLAFGPAACNQTTPNASDADDDAPQDADADDADDADDDDDDDTPQDAGADDGDDDAPSDEDDDDDGDGDDAPPQDAGADDGDDDAPSDEVASQDAGGGDEGDAAHYALGIQVRVSDTEWSSYLVVTDTLDSAEALTADKGIEVAGRALVAGPHKGGVLFAGSDFAPELTRYTLEGGGTLKAGKTLSFAAYGVTHIGEYAAQFHFVSDTRAYYLDPATAQAIAWDPSAMTIIGASTMSELLLDGGTLMFSQGATFETADNWIVPAASRVGLDIPQQTSVALVDLDTGDARVVSDDRCAFARDGVVGDDGLLYLATETFASAVYTVNDDAATPPCMVRFDMTAGAFDGDFFVDLAMLSPDGLTFGGLVQSNGTTYTRYLTPSLEVAIDTHPRALTGASAWGWAKVTLGAEPSVKLLPDADLSSGSMLQMRTDLGLITPEFVMSTDTALRAISDDPTVTRQVDGLAFSLVQLD